MTLKEILYRFKKGVRTGMSAFSESNTLNDVQVIKMIDDFNNSNRRKMMLKGEQYYEVKNGILNRRITKKVNGQVIEESYKANNKLAHAKYKNMVDEKIAYLLSRDYSLKCDDQDEYMQKVKDVLGKHFQYSLTGLGYECSNKGIGWLYCYVNEKGEFKTMITPSEQCIPVWTDRSHTELDMMIRVYPTTVWEFDKAKDITNVEVWSRDDVKYYKLDGKSLLPYMDKNYEGEAAVSHYKRDDTWVSWGKVPFVAFKNNRHELTDLSFVESLVDGYDLSRSEAANYVEEVKNLIFVLKGYGGEDISEFMRRLNEDRAIPIDDPEEGGVDTLTPTMDITALREHYEQLKRDLIEDGQSINKDLDKFGSAPSGVALKFMYSGLDLKCNLMETEFKIAFENLTYFINQYLGIDGAQYEGIIDILFNRDMEINESEVIENCQKSKNIVSDDTILGNHPWVKDIEKEQDALQLQMKESEPTWDKTPLPLGGGTNVKE